MTNQQGTPIQTEFPIELGGKQYTLMFPIPAIWAFEDRSGAKILTDEGGGSEEDIKARAQMLQGRTLREQTSRTVDLLWAGMQTRHPEMTPEQVGAMVFPWNHQKVQEEVWSALAASLPKRPADAEGSDPLATTVPQG